MYAIRSYYELRQKIFNCYKNTIDGLGCKRIIDSILNQSETIRIRNVKKSDVTAVYNLSNEDYVRRHSINKNKIPFEEHIKWFENIIDSQNHIFYVATNEADEFLGQIRFKLDRITSYNVCYTKLLRHLINTRQKKYGIQNCEHFLEF